MNNKALRFSGLLFAAWLFAACGGQRQDEGDEPKNYELLTVTASDHELTTEYAASLKGQKALTNQCPALGKPAKSLAKSPAMSRVGWTRKWKRSLKR